MGALSRGLKRRLAAATAAALFCLSLSLAASTGPAEAAKVGVAAAVNPDAFSSLAGTPQTQLNIGKSIFFNERINTTGSGLVQVLLVDGSTFTVGPGSDLVIDKFVYDPKKGTGEIAASFSKGVMRFVGGKISKNDNAVSIKTPAGALAIRGCIVLGKMQSSSNFGFVLVYGDYMKMKNQTVFEPGNGFFGQNGKIVIGPATKEIINGMMAGLSSGGTGGTGVGGDSKPAGTSGTGNSLWQSTSTDPSALINTFTQSQIQDTLQEQEQQAGNNSPPPCTGPECNPPPPCQGEACNPLPQPTPVNVRVLSSPGVYTAFGGAYITDSGSGILGGGDYPDDTNPTKHADDFITTFGYIDGRLRGTVSGLVDTHLDCTNGPQECTLATNTPPDAMVEFPWFAANENNEDGPCHFGICAVTDAKITQDGVTTTFQGVAVFKPGFFAYQVMGVPPALQDLTHIESHLTDSLVGPGTDPLIIFGGTGYTFAPASGKAYSFALLPDISQADAFGPFASATSSPIQQVGPGYVSNAQGTGYVSPLVLLEKDGTANDTSQAVWLQANFFVGSGEKKGEFFINVALGEWDPTTGLSGARRGGSMVAIDQDGNPNPQTYSFSGDIASLAGPDDEGSLSHFMGEPGSNPNVVIGFDSTGTHNIGRDNPLNQGYTSIENQSGATYHIGVGMGSTEAGDQHSGTLHGYAAGFAQSPSGSADILANVSPNDVTVQLDAAQNTMIASLHLGNGVLQNPKYNLEFGGAERSAFIDDNIFAAIERKPDDPTGSSVDQTKLVRLFPIKTETTNYPVRMQGFIASSGAINADAVLFSGKTVLADPENPESAVQKKAFCQTCDFLKWGAWGARVEYNNGQPVTKDVQLGWWIAGEVANKDQLPLDGSAKYAGDAIGNVTSNGQQYVATGNMNMDWNFASQKGTLAISEFDGKAFQGKMLMPGNVQQFDGVLTGKGGLIGAANGSFVGATQMTNNTPGAPRGVIGNFGVGNSTWQATGIFGGTQKTP